MACESAAVCNRPDFQTINRRTMPGGRYRYDSRFALPVFDDNGEVERYNIFNASMLIRHANDGKLYLYDVLEIKKETSNPLES
jgi:hypothetical protein